MMEKVIHLWMFFYQANSWVLCTLMVPL